MEIAAVSQETGQMAQMFLCCGYWRPVSRGEKATEGRKPPDVAAQPFYTQNWGCCETTAEFVSGAGANDSGEYQFVGFCVGKDKWIAPEVIIVRVPHMQLD